MGAVAVLGIGNILKADDGVGVRAVQYLQREGLLPGVELRDAGTAPFDMLDAFLLCDVVVVLDCVRRGGEPGTVYRVTPDELDRAAESARFAHSVGVRDTVRVARALGSRADVIVLGVEPADLGSSLELSAPVEAALPELLATVVATVDAGARTSA